MITAKPHGVPSVMLLLAVVVGMVLVELPPSAVAGRFYSLTTPPSYTVFSDDLEISYTIPGDVSLPHAFVRLEYNRKGRQDPMIITTMGLRLGLKTGNLRVACGVIEFAGNYTLKMFTRVNGDILTRASLDVRWPDVALSLPDHHDAQTSSVELRIISNANCSSLLHREYLQLELYYQRTDIEEKMLLLSVADRLFAANFTAIDKPFSTLNLGCHLFDLDGSYQIILSSSAVDSPMLAVSNIMAVKWSYGYHLSVMTQSAFPCYDSITVIYTHPPCSGLDKLRLYSFKLMSEGSLASPMEENYIMETVADPDQTQMTFDCKLFNESASGFCFLYVSVTRGDVVSEQKRLCIPAQPNSVFPIDGGWSRWTSWTPCSVTCGTGKRSRFRMCNEPAPKHGGRFCDGNPVEWTPCDLHCPESIPRTPLHSPDIDPNCACGCTRSEEKGKIIATGRCHGLSAWIIQAKNDQIVSLHFDYFSLNYTRQWVKIRDGALPSDILLFSSSNRGYPMEIVTSGSSMRVEFMTSYISPPPVAIFPKNATLPIHAHGFIASYDVRVTTFSSTAPVLFQYEKKTVMGSTITIVGIVICAVVVIVAVVFVVLQRTFFRRRVKYTMATSGDSPAHPMTGSVSEHRVSSGHSSSPSSPGNAVHVDMDVPLTGKTQRKSSGGRTSRASSTSSTHSQKVKRFRTKSESASADKGSGKSPKLPSKEYTPVTSPYGIEIIDTDEIGGGGTSGPKPERIKSPRSPTLQSSKSNRKRSPVTSSPPVTKLDILNKKRQDKKGKGVTADLDREVTGSSGSRTPSTTKAEINWPQSNFVKSALNEMGRSFADRQKRSGQRPPSEEIPLIDSMTSSLESPSHFNAIVKSDSVESATTSFVKPVTSTVRRPTSLTESYSSESLQKSKSKTESAGECAVLPVKSETKLPKRDSSTKPVQLSSSSTPTSSVKDKIRQSSLSSSSSSSKPSHPVKATSSRAFLDSSKSANKQNKTAFEERQSLLPKPDGQSPKLQRRESPKTSAGNKKGPSSPGKASMSSSKGSKNTVSSPTRSIATPSEIEGQELEYDDFIEDDPLSYFDYEETQKLAFRGVEKIGKKPAEEEEEDENGT